MPPAFTLGHIIGPVAVATVLNVFVFAMLWRWDRVEIRTGAPTWQIFVAIPFYGLPLLAFLVWTEERPITTAAQVFGAAMVGEIVGGVLLYGLLNAFLWTRGQPIGGRLIPMVISGGLFVFIATTVFRA